MKGAKKSTFLQVWTSSKYDILSVNLCNLVAQLLSRGKNKSVSGGILEKQRRKEVKPMRTVYLFKVKWLRYSAFFSITRRELLI